MTPAEMVELADRLTPEERKLFWECANYEGPQIGEKEVRACIKTLRMAKLQKLWSELQAEIELAVMQKDHAAVKELIGLKDGLAKEIKKVQI